MGGGGGGREEADCSAAGTFEVKFIGAGGAGVLGVKVSGTEGIDSRAGEVESARESSLGWRGVLVRSESIVGCWVGAAEWSEGGREVWAELKLLSAPLARRRRGVLKFARHSARHNPLPHRDRLLLAVCIDEAYTCYDIN